MLFRLFSRFSNKRVKKAIDLDIKVDFAQLFVQKLSQIQQATHADSTMCELSDMILRGWPDTFKEVGKDMRPHFILIVDFYSKYSFV